jgi:hypothetical protein
MASIIGITKIFDGTENVGAVLSVSKGLSTTAMIPLNAADTYALFMDASSTGVIALTVECITNYKDDITTAVEPDGMSDIATIADGNVHHAALDPPAAPYMAVKITGTGANDAATRITAWLISWESM